MSESKVDRSGKPLHIVAHDFWTKFQFGSGPDRTGPLITMPQKDVLGYIRGLRLTEASLVDGYMPTCKHAFVRNPYTAKQVTPESVPMGPAVEPLIRKQFKARVKGEKRVEMAYVTRADAIKHDLFPECRYLDVIMYKCEPGEPGDWKVVMVKAQTVDFELPMEVATAKRNASGETGGSGTGLDEAAMKSAETYWAHNVRVI